MCSLGRPVCSLHHRQPAMPRCGEDRARGFDGEVLGLEQIPKPPALATRGGAWFREGGRLEFLQPDP